MSVEKPQLEPTPPSAPARAGGTNVYAVIAAVGVGAAAMYFLDPARGRRRRHAAADRLAHAAHVLEESATKTRRDVVNRTRGIAAVTRRAIADEDADDPVIADRVRAILGRAVSHPRAIDVSVHEARVTLAGAILEDEASHVLEAVRRVRGVHAVEDRLERHRDGADVPSLHGGHEPAAPQFDFLQENWTPAVRLLAGVTGGALLAATRSRRRGLAASIARAAGVALAVRAMTNLSFRRLTGVAGGAYSVAVRKSIHIDAPIDDVFIWLTAWERWPAWMSHVREVRRVKAQDGQGEHTHWIVDGPAGIAMEWDAVTTRLEPPSLIAWRTREGNVVDHSGTIHLVPTDIGWTRVDVRLSYTPKAGALGHGVAKLFRRDPKRQLEQDLARLKTTIETGRPPRDAAKPAPGPVDVR